MKQPQKGKAPMTRFDIFIRKMILDALSMSHLELNIHQEAFIQKMIQETYQNSQLFLLPIEERVAYVVNQYRNHVLALT